MPKPRKPTSLHLVTATLHPTKHKDRKNEPQPAGKLVKPEYLSPKSLRELRRRIRKLPPDGNVLEMVALKARLDIDKRASKIWDSDSDVAFWLTIADSHAFGRWCRMTAELELFERDSAWCAQWRMLGSELGFFAGSRSKINMREGDAPKGESDQFYA